MLFPTAQKHNIEKKQFLAGFHVRTEINLKASTY